MKASNKPPGYWLMKSDPGEYGWEDLSRDGRTTWDGVRNHQARQALQAMRPGDRVLFYHSGRRPEIVGLARVVSLPYPDPTAADPKWVAVDIEPEGLLAHPVALPRIKADPELKSMPLVRQSRLSVMMVAQPEFEHILDLAEGQASEPPPARTAKPPSTEETS